MGGALFAALLIAERIVGVATMPEDAPKAIRLVVGFIDSLPDILVGFAGAAGVFILALRWESSIAGTFRRTIVRCRSALWTLEAALWGVRVTYWIDSGTFASNPPRRMVRIRSGGSVQIGWDVLSRMGVSDQEAGDWVYLRFETKGGLYGLEFARLMGLDMGETPASSHESRLSFRCNTYKLPINTGRNGELILHNIKLTAVRLADVGV